MDRPAVISGAAGNNGFIDVRVNRNFFAGVGGCTDEIRPNGLQVDGHADQMTAAGFGVTDEPLKLQIGFFRDALVLHADIQAKRARLSSCQ